MSLSSVAASGDRLETLRALRDYLAKALDETDSARDKASLSARFADVIREIAEIEELLAEEEDDDDFGDLLNFEGCSG